MGSTAVDPSLFPVALRLAGRSCLVVGGGPVALRKVEALRRAGALVTVVAPEVVPELRALAARDDYVTWMPRTFHDDDAVGRTLVVAATSDRGVNRSVAAACWTRGALVNVVDDPDLCDFLVPSVAERGRLQIAVSTGGLAPGLAARLRARFEREFDADWGTALVVLGGARRAILDRVDGTEDERRAALAALADLDVEALLRDGGPEAVERAVAQVVSGCSSPR